MSSQTRFLAVLHWKQTHLCRYILQLCVRAGQPNQTQQVSTLSLRNYFRRRGEEKRKEKLTHPNPKGQGQVCRTGLCQHGPMLALWKAMNCMQPLIPTSLWAQCLWGPFCSAGSRVFAHSPQGVPFSFEGTCLIC